MGDLKTGEAEQRGLYSREFEHDSCGIGFVADIKGKASHEILQRGLEALERMEHRGAESADNRTGDGAGVLMQIPHEFYLKALPGLPAPGAYGTGLVFFQGKKAQETVSKRLEETAASFGLECAGWRTVATDDREIGLIAKSAEPEVGQVFFTLKNDRGKGAGDEVSDLDFALFLARKKFEKILREDPALADFRDCYIPSLSSRTIVYKGMLMPRQLRLYYPELQDPAVKTAVALIHSRFSTNTFPAWPLAQPFRMLSHNGEINTIKGNRFWMAAREALYSHPRFGGALAEILPAIEPGRSDSASLDNALELLVMSGRRLPHALMMLIPEAWNDRNPISQELKAFYQYHACIMEPWDGPASLVFCDGRYVGGTLDRNGLRPSRYTVTRDGLIVMASETGVQDFKPEEVAYKGRLLPGKLLLVDLQEGRIIPDNELKGVISRQKPYMEWVARNTVTLRQEMAGEAFVDADLAPEGSLDEDAVYFMERAFGYTREDREKLLLAMAEGGQEPTASMGTDTPLAVFSAKSQRVFSYFKQVFAQVTNPPIDSIREELVMTLTSFAGPQQNLLDETEAHCRRIKVLSPVLTGEDLENLRAFAKDGYPSRTLDAVFTENLEASLDRLVADAVEAVKSGAALLVLSDRKALNREQGAGSRGEVGTRDQGPGTRASVSESFLLPGDFPVDSLTAASFPPVPGPRSPVPNSETQFTSDTSTPDSRLPTPDTPIPSLLAVAAVHHGLIRAGLRMNASIVAETAEPREVMHFALLFGYGADLIAPYGALATVASLCNSPDRDRAGDFAHARKNYIKGIQKAILKITSKMGTSTLRSYRGAQVFEAIGLADEVIAKCFPGTVSRIGGADFAALEGEARARMREACAGAQDHLLAGDGQYSWRKYGEKHAWNPETIYLLQWAARDGNYGTFKKFTAAADALNRSPHVIRGLFDFITPESAEGPQDRPRQPVPLDEVEPAEEIMRRFTTGAMSFGSISKEAHETIAEAMNSIKGRSNSGEGGEDPARFARRPDGVWVRSAIKQVASGRFGVTSEYLANAAEIQIKIAQGAKPGEGGQLPGHKVDISIAKTRHSTPGVTLISPPPHHDIYSIEDLAELIFDLKNANPQARISVKLVSESGVGTVAAGVAKAHADNILISGYDGGTGASPQSSIRHAGLPWEIGLAETHQVLVTNGLRGRVRLQTDGQLKTGRDIVIAGMLGAEEFGFGTAVLIVMGCVMMRKCHLNTCPMGVATQDPELRRRFAGKAEYLINYFKFLAEETREIMASLGFRTFAELIGRADLLAPRKIEGPKAAGIDVSRLLYRPEGPASVPGGTARYCIQDQIHRIDQVLDRKLAELCFDALEKKIPTAVSLPVKNTDRAVGAMLSYEVSKRFGGQGLPDNFVTVDFTGSAGQSFGAFLAQGITFRLAGDSNDYLGKGLSGGRIVVAPPAGSAFKTEENILIGNTVLYGATGGELFAAGVAGERFAVRNSGANAVVEGTGDHCAEYMTGGRVIVLGNVGRNFGAGMSGGIAYILDLRGNFEYFLNKGMVELSGLDYEDDESFVRDMIKKHIYWTGSAWARGILDNWADMRLRFVKVLPVEYKRALQQAKLAELDRKLYEIRERQELEVKA